jgi:hypothetical protein
MLSLSFDQLDQRVLRRIAVPRVLDLILGDTLGAGYLAELTDRQAVQVARHRSSASEKKPDSDQSRAVRQQMSLLQVVAADCSALPAARTQNKPLFPLDAPELKCRPVPPAPERPEARDVGQVCTGPFRAAAVDKKEVALAMIIMAFTFHRHLELCAGQ